MHSEYLLILPQKYVPFYTKLNHELTTNPIGVFRNGETIRRVVRHIVKRPYPVLPLICSLDNKEFQELCIQQAWGLMSADYELDKLLTFVVFSGDLANKLPNIQETVSQKSKEHPEKTLLALLARNDQDFLTNILSTLTTDQTNHQILKLALDNGEHFVLFFMHKLHLRLHRNKDLDQFVKDKHVRNNLIILKVINEFSVQPNQAIRDVGNMNKPIGFLTSIKSELSNAQRWVLEEVLRVNQALDFFKSKMTSVIVPMKKIVQGNGILEVLYEYGNLSHFMFDELARIVENTSKGDQEMKILVHVFVLSTTLDFILGRRKKDEFYKSKLNDLNVILRQIKDMEFTVLMLEDIFRIIFLRWEHLHIPSEQVNKKSTNSSSEVDSYFEADQIIPKKQGFICQGKALKHLLTYLKNFVTKKSHSEEFKKSPRFLSIVETVNDGLWKLSVLEKVASNEGVVSDELPLSKENIFQMIRSHKNFKEKSSSDDDSKERVNYASLSKRKAKNRRKSNPNEDIDKSNGEKQLSSKSDGNVICKMLISTEDLAEMALCVENFSEIKGIIQKCNLKNTKIEKDMTFLESQLSTQKKLQTINEKYEQEEVLSSRALTQIEQIKMTASKGFEASKINNIVDNFTRTNFIYPKSLESITKYINHYKFLEQYSTLDNFKVIPVLDLILTTSFGYEICGNIYTLLGKDRFDKASKTTNMGPLTFLVNLIECLRLLKSKEKFGIKEILTKNFYSLNPRVCQWELQREDIFKNIFYKSHNDIGQLDCLRRVSKNFDDLRSQTNYFQRFYSFISNFIKLLFLRDRNIEFHISEILKFDLRTIIGDLIFEKELTPFEIENTVSALNLNLVHVTAINICPRILKNPEGLREYTIAQINNQSIFNYIANQNTLLGYLVQKIKNYNLEDRPFYNIKEEFLQRIGDLPDIRDNFEIIFEKNTFLSVLLADSVEVGEILNLEDKFLVFNILNVMNPRNEDVEIQKNKVIENLVAQNAVKYLYLVESLSDVRKRTELILENYTKIQNFKLVKELIESLLLHKDRKSIPEEHCEQLERVLEDIQRASESCKKFNAPSAYENAVTEELKEKFGCDLKCKLEGTELYKDGSWSFKKKSKQTDLMKECADHFPKDQNLHDCRYFYNVYTCFEQLRFPLRQDPKYKEIEDSGKCEIQARQEIGVSEAEMDKILIGEEEICYFKELGLFVNGTIKSENVYKGLMPLLRKFVVETLDLCKEETYDLLNLNETYSPKYFYEFKKCYYRAIVDWK